MSNTQNAADATTAAPTEAVDAEMDSELNSSDLEEIEEEKIDEEEAAVAAAAAEKAREAYRIGKKRKPAEASVDEPDSDSEPVAMQAVHDSLRYPDLPRTEKEKDEYKLKLEAQAQQRQAQRPAWALKDAQKNPPPPPPQGERILRELCHQAKKFPRPRKRRGS